MGNRKLRLAQPLVHIAQIIVSFRVAWAELQYPQVARDRPGILSSGIKQISEREMGIDMIGPSRNSAPEMFDGLSIPSERLQEQRIRVVDPGMIRRQRKGLFVAGRRGVEVARAGVDGAQAPMCFGSVLVSCDRLAEVAFRIVEPVG